MQRQRRRWPWWKRWLFNKFNEFNTLNELRSPAARTLPLVREEQAAEGDDVSTLFHGPVRPFLAYRQMLCQQRGQVAGRKTQLHRVVHGGGRR